MNYKHYKRLKALGFPVENFSVLKNIDDFFMKKGAGIAISMMSPLEKALGYSALIKDIIKPTNPLVVMRKVDFLLQQDSGVPELQLILNKYKKSFTTELEHVLNEAKKNNGHLDGDDPALNSIKKIIINIQIDLREFFNKHGKKLSKKVMARGVIKTIDQDISALKEKQRKKIDKYQAKAEASYNKKINRLANLQDHLRQKYINSF